MRIGKRGLRVSATDLSNHLACGHLTSLNRAVAEKRIPAPPNYPNPALDQLKIRGYAHENAYVEQLRGSGLSIEQIDEQAPDGAERTRKAILRGVDVIVQAHLGNDNWYGRADILQKVARKTAQLDWSYEVYDTKLARETRGTTMLQLCLYSDLLRDIQGGDLPEHTYVVTPGTDLTPQSYRVAEYAAYYRSVRRQLEATLQAKANDGATYPDPVAQCDICRFNQACDKRRRADDHLSLVAGIRKSHTVELNAWGVPTLAALAKMPIPIKQKPKRGARESYEKVREQARVQFEERETKSPKFEMLNYEEGTGLYRLPEPSPGDLFFDFEGDPFVGEGGIEYLFGYVDSARSYTSLWGFDARAEKANFEAFVDSVMARWAKFPSMHIYHFAPYEPSALKRLMGRYATREEQIDRMLRAGMFIDLYAVVKQSLRASVERYSIKDLEKFYGLKREIDLRVAGNQRAALEFALEAAEPSAISKEVQDAVEGYNKDDCVSTLALRNWLEQLRAEEVKKGKVIARPAVGDGEPSQELSEQRLKVLALMERITRDVPAAREERTPEQQARWILAQLLEFHRRENKSTLWDFFRLRETPDEDLLEERGALYGLEFVKALPKKARERNATHRYKFPAQECDAFREKVELHYRDQRIGTLVDYDLTACTIDIKKNKESEGVHPPGIFAYSKVEQKVLEESLFALGEWVAENGIDADGEHRAARDLLLRLAPRRTKNNEPLFGEDESLTDAACRVALTLNGATFAIQGPPGAGKSHTGAEMIRALVRAGKKVGIVGPSHKVIRNLLDKLCELSTKSDKIRCVEKVNETSNDCPDMIEEVTDNGEVLAALAAGAQVAAGTAWLWARPDIADAVDVLFIDEAGQLALANTLAVARSAKNLVLLGDPQQLDQPLKGAHPNGADVSALAHLLGDHKTIPADMGLFLAETWRLHPAICRFTSEQFYEDRLKSRPGRDTQQILGATPFAGAGLHYVPVVHEGNRGHSPEEADKVAELWSQIIAAKTKWVDHKGTKNMITSDDILIVAPYNAQVFALTERLPNARIGTVDKFQGQEAPIVIISMATSSAEEAPRGMEFLYSLNRLNVATSRAKCLCILVANSKLLEPECRSPRQIQLANSFCRYAEMAQPA